MKTIKKSWKQKIKILISFLGVVGIVVHSIMENISFFTAYFNPSKTVLININKVGEANLEVALILVLTICSMFVICDYILGKLKEK